MFLSKEVEGITHWLEQMEHRQGIDWVTEQNNGIEKIGYGYGYTLEIGKIH